jgi:SAM-dependent methyltransferase
MKKIIKKSEEIMEMISAFRASRILLSAYELDLFTTIDGKALSAEEAAKEAKLSLRGTEILLDALTALGFLSKKNGKYSNAQTASRFLVRGKPEYMYGLGHQNHLWDSWSKLSGSVRTGRPVPKDPINDRGDEWLDSFVGAMNARGRAQALEVLPLLDFSGVSRLLDLGGGSGVFAATFAGKHENVSAVVFDLPSVVPITRSYLDRHPAGKKVQTMSGDYLVDDIGKDYDMIFMSAVVHSNSSTENAGLVKKCARALNAGGRICIVDYVTNDDHTESENAAVFAVNMLVNTDGGRSYSFKDISGWLEGANLTDIELKRMNRGLGVVSGRKG